MTEEIKPEEQPEEKPDPTYLEQVRAENEVLGKLIDSAAKQASELKELKAEQILSGKADAGQGEKKDNPESAAEYAERALSGKVEEK